MCSFCWGELERLIHQKNKYAQEEKPFCICFSVNLSIYFCCYLGEALRAGVSGFAVDDFLLIPEFPP